MKIEKINDYQIRCTLTKADLADRELKISELAYGTEKAKSLFRDMMQQAALKFGFETDDIPIMIEAIPLNADCLVLVITKVEDPEELDTRFSKFAPSIHDDDDGSEDSTLSADLSHAGDEVLDLFKRIKDHAASLAKAIPDSSRDLSGTVETAPASDADEESSPLNALRIFAFHSLYEILQPASIVNTSYSGESYLYKDPENGQYLLVVKRSHCSKESFNKVCNVLSEYGQLKKGLASSHSYYEEHFEQIAGPDALDRIAMS